MTWALASFLWWWVAWRRSTCLVMQLFKSPQKSPFTNWRVRWKEGVRYFTQNRTLSKTLQISHAVLFKCLKQCSACFFPEACFLFEILRTRKNTFFLRHPLGTFCWMKNKRTICFAKRWCHYNTLIIQYCFVSASWMGQSRLCFAVTLVRYEVGQFFFFVLFLYFFQRLRYLFKKKCT